MSRKARESVAVEAGAEGRAPHALVTLAWGAFAVMAVVVCALVAAFFGRFDSGFPPAEDVTSALPAWFAMLLGALLVAGLAWLLSLRPACLASAAGERRRRDQFGLVVGVAAAALFCLQVVLVCAIAQHPGWDAGTLYNHAYYLASGMGPYEFYGPDGGAWVRDYLDTYPNNALICVVMWGVAALLEPLGISSLYACCLLGAASVCVGGVLSAAFVRRITRSDAVAYAGFALYAALFGLSPWVSVAYSDTYSCAFVGGVLYLSLGVLDVPAASVAPDVAASDRPLWRRALRWFALGLVAFVGYLLKPTVAIVLMALLVVCATRLASRGMRGQRLGRALACALGLVAAAALVLGALSPACHRALGINDASGRALGMAHFFMLGQNEEHTGAWLDTDVAFSTSIEDPAQRQRANLDEALGRIAGRGVAGNAAFWAKKVVFSFGDGAFSWAVDADWDFLVNVTPTDDPLAHALRSLFWLDAWQEGADQTAFLTWSQLLWYALLALWVPCGVAGVATRGRFGAPRGGTSPSAACLAGLVPAVTLMGMLVYLVIFEDRGRYLYCLGPVSVAASMLGLWALARLFARLRARRAARASF